MTDEERIVTDAHPKAVLETRRTSKGMRYQVIHKLFTGYIQQLSSPCLKPESAWKSAARRVRQSALKK